MPQKASFRIPMIAKWLPEDYLKTIVLFELPDEKGGFSSHGTGVLLNYKQVFFLATCKHIVLKPSGLPYEKLHATINKTDGTVSRKDIEAIHTAFKLQWFFHKNPDVDLALCPIAIEQGVEDIELIGENLFEDFANIPTGDDIFFLGYPLNLGIQNVPKLSPLIRIGVVALKNNDSTLLLDANVYPGSSGSPVFYKPVLAQQDGNTTNIGTRRPCKFLGIVSGNICTIEEAISKRTGRTRTIFEENAGLGIVYSTSLLNEILSYKEVQDILPKTIKAQEKTEKDPANNPVK